MNTFLIPATIIIVFKCEKIFSKKKIRKIPRNEWKRPEI
jgi:hypothetical protein